MKLSHTFTSGLADEIEVVDQPDWWFLSQAKVVWKAMHTAALAVTAASPSQRQHLYTLCSWVCNQLELREYFECDEPDTLLAILQMTACLERALGNVSI